MPEYIDREQLKKAVHATDLVNREKMALLACVSSIPAADVAPVRHGWWKDPAVGVYGCLCSVCKKQSDNCFNYCPNCGAKMDGGIDG